METPIQGSGDITDDGSWCAVVGCHGDPVGLSSCCVSFLGNIRKGPGVRRAWLSVRGFMQSPLVLEVPKISQGWTIGWPIQLCSSHGLTGLGGLDKPTLALTSWARSDGKRGLWVEAHVSRHKPQGPANHFPSGSWLGCYGPSYPTTHMTMSLKRASACPAEGGQEGGWYLWPFPAGSRARN